MQYCFQLCPHSNAFYTQALKKLGQMELSCMLHSIGVSSNVHCDTIGGCDFWTFDADLNNEQLHILSRHSSVLMMCGRQNGLLRPVQTDRASCFPRECAEILKYKGKTSTSFTRLMINLALSAGNCLKQQHPLLLDPMCGRGTTLFASLESGCNAVGIDVDKNDLHEGSVWFAKFLTRERFKHEQVQSSLTLSKGHAPSSVFTFATDKESYKSGKVQTLTLLQGDTALCCSALKNRPADALVCDLPYGVQHAPQSGQKAQKFTDTLKRAMPAWHKALKPGAAIALGFNVLTLPRNELTQIAEAAGFEALNEPPYGACEHFVEQAVHRDVLVAVRR